MKARWLVTAGLSLSLTGGVFAAQTIVAYGDTRTNASWHQEVVTAYAKFNPNIVLHTGDIWDGYTSAQWLSHLTGNPVTKKLLDDSLFLVARGNHEEESEVLNLRPKIVRNGSIHYSLVRDNVFFLCLGYGPASTNLAYARQQLSSAAAKNADWRIVFFHAPMYSTGKHGGAYNATMVNLCDSFKVNAIFNGHDHIYERSKLMYKNEPRSSATTITDTVGTINIVIGVGGAPFYTVAGNANTAFKMANKLAFCVIKTTPTTMRIECRGTDTTLIDAVTWTKGSTAVKRTGGESKSLPVGISASFAGNALTLQNLPFTGSMSAELYSITGKLICTKPLQNSGTSAQIHVGDVCAGSYAVCVRQGDAYFWTPMVVK